LLSVEETGMGTLYIVGTPIGNLEDITARALRILREVAVIAAEDTRQTRKLLNHFEIPTAAVSYHEHNQRTAGPQLIERLLAGDDVAVVTDAGMPAISDPGADLVRLALEAGIPVVPVPGPTAFTTAVVVSGLNTDRFVFEGFLPAKGKERRAALESLMGIRRAGADMVITYYAKEAARWLAEEK
jgi:16S rRNA (cytidine1402-2'-O)-methyltransferase